MIEDIVLSPILIFLMFLAVLLVVTQWASRKREIPGYLLGWMIGVFFIIIYQSATGTTPQPEPEIVEEVQQNAGRLTASAIFLPSVLGLMGGLGASAVYAFIVRTHARRSIGVALMTATLVFTLFMIATASDSGARVFGVFALAFGIGVLGTLVVTGGRTPGARAQAVNRSRERFDTPPPAEPHLEEARRSPFGMNLDRFRPNPRPNPRTAPNQPARPASVAPPPPPRPVDEPIEGAEVEQANLDRARDRFNQLRGKPPE